MIQDGKAVETTPAQNNSEFQFADVTGFSDRPVTAKDLLNGLSAFYEGRTFTIEDVRKRIFLNDAEVATRDEMLSKAKAQAEADGTDVEEAMKKAYANFISTLDPRKRVGVVFTTNLGNDALIYVSSYTEPKTKLDNQGKKVLRDGDFDKAVYDVLSSVQGDEDYFDKFKELLERFKGKTIVVKRKYYTSAPFNRTASIPCFHTK